MPLSGQLSPERPESAAPEDQEVRRHIPFFLAVFCGGAGDRSVSDRPAKRVSVLAAPAPSF